MGSFWFSARGICLSVALWLVAGGGSAVGQTLLQLNCGGGRASGGWSGDSKYAIGEKVWTAAPISNLRTTPPNVYQTGRVGRKLAYSFPDLPDGSYRVRLHFAEVQSSGLGERLFKVKCEGVTAVPILDVVDRAGGPNRAVRLALDVIVNDGNGLQLALKGIRGPAMLNGLEIISLAALPVSN
jgi:hypothetical protein